MVKKPSVPSACCFWKGYQRLKAILLAEELDVLDYYDKNVSSATDRKLGKTQILISTKKTELFCWCRLQKLGTY